jgi:hypothetical protein
MLVSKIIEIMQVFPDNVIGVGYSGSVTGIDYVEVLNPVLKEKLKNMKI